jgi:hypothetical protein
VTEREETMRCLYGLFNARKIEQVLTYMHSDVDWPNAIDGTRIRGLDRVWEHWTSQFVQFRPYVEPLDFETSPDGRLRVRVRQSVSDFEGTLIDEQELFHVFEFKDQRIVRMDIVEP